MENGKKLLQQPGEEYTHGGVKKTKFEPKMPSTRRLKKAVSASVDSEAGEAQRAGGEAGLPKELQRLLQQVESDRPSQARTSRVAFGFTGTVKTQSPSSSSGFPGAGRAGKVAGSGSNISRGAKREVVSRVVEKQEFMQEDGTHVEDRLKRTEEFDYEKYYPVTLPLRKPGGGDPRLLDEGEFRDGEDVEEEDESGVEAAQELGLTERKDDSDTLFFFQFPKGLPLSLNPSGKEKAASEKLEDLGNGGAMGKLLVYESGAVKFKIGDVILDALPGTECTFAQEVAAVNTTTKRCGFVGEVHKRVVLTPDITDALPDLTDLRTKP